MKALVVFADTSLNLDVPRGASHEDVMDKALTEGACSGRCVGETAIVFLFETEEGKLEAAKEAAGVLRERLCPGEEAGKLLGCSSPPPAFNAEMFVLEKEDVE